MTSKNLFVATVAPSPLPRYPGRTRGELSLAYWPYRSNQHGSFADGAGGFLPGVPLGCLDMGPSPGPSLHRFLGLTGREPRPLASRGTRAQAVTSSIAATMRGTAIAGAGSSTGSFAPHCLRCSRVSALSSTRRLLMKPVTHEASQVCRQLSEYLGQIFSYA